MKIIYDKKGSGKTTKLIQMSHDTNTYILTTGTMRAEYIANIARGLGIKIPYPVTVDEYMRNNFNGSCAKNILIDDAEDVLKNIFYTVNIQ